MGHHPETMVYSFPKYGGKLSRFDDFIGFDIWHIDPEKHVEGRRRDDSCGWFPRDLTPELKRAVSELQNPHNDDFMSRIFDAFAQSYVPDHKYMSLKEMPMWVAYPTHLMALQRIDRIAFNRWRQPFWKRVPERAALIERLAQQLAFSTVDNLNGPFDDHGQYLRLLAACYRREIRPWYKHPRFHIHHWKVNFALIRNIKRMFQRCDDCNGRIGFGCSPTKSDGKTYHSDCLNPN